MVALFGTFNNQCTFFRRGSADDAHFSRIISYDGTLAVFWIKPPLRLSGTSPQGEAFSAPIKGNCRHCRLWGGFFATYDRHYEYLLSVIYFCILLTVYHRLICRSDNSAAADNFFKSMCAPAYNS